MKIGGGTRGLSKNSYKDKDGESKIKDYLLGFTMESDFLKPPARLQNCLRLANM